MFFYLEFKEEQSHDDTIVSKLDQEHCNEEPCPDNIDRILHPILNQNMLIQCVDTDLVLNLEITPGINLKALSSHQILRSIIPNLGENFQSTLPSQLFKSSCMGLSLSQVVTFEILNQKFKHYHVIGEKALHVSSQSSVMNNFFLICKSILWMAGEGV